MGSNIRNQSARVFASTALVLALSAFGIGTALATPPGPAPNGSNKVQASATIQFRIVVAETLRLDGPQQRQSATAPTTTHTVADLGDHRMVTVARP